MSLDAWKKVYMNEDTDTIALPWFWKNFDREGYSIWFSEYQFNKDLSMVFMTHNLIKGMFQRIESLSKNCFGSVLIFGKNNDNAIVGVWVMRGQELVFNVSNLPLGAANPWWLCVQCVRGNFFHLI